MWPVRAILAICAVVCLVTRVVPATPSEESEPTGTVELTVHRPDGQLLRNGAIEILPYRSHRSSNIAPLKTQTDERGVARFSWPVGVTQVYMTARGAGHGGTGIFELLAKKTARPAMPPLLPFGAIEGILPRELLEPAGLSVMLTRSNGD